MTIEQLSNVDSVAIDRHGNAVLAISDHLAWDDADAHLFSLQEKLNTYLKFIESGEIYEKHPEAVGRPIIICVIMNFPVPDSAQWFFTKVRAIIKADGFSFEVRQVLQ